MKPVFATEGLKALLNFPFRDAKAAQKTLIGSLLMFAQFIIPVLPGIVVMGYLSRVLRRVTEGDGQASMPEWDDWGGLFMDGVKVFAAIFVYSLPMILIVGFLYFMMFAPMVVLPLLDETGPEAVGLMMAVMILVELFMFLIIAFMMVVYAIYIVILPPIIAHTAAKNQFGAAFEIGRWWKIFRKIS